MTIRPATGADANTIGEIHTEAWRWAYRGHLPDDYLDGIDQERRSRYWRRTLGGDGPTRTFVAEHPGRGAVGYVQVGPPQHEGTEEGVGELYSIYLRPEVVGRGV